MYAPTRSPRVRPGSGLDDGDGIEESIEYFEDEPEANAADPILSRIERQNSIPTLLAKKQADGAYRFDIHLQGPNETIFFDI